MSSRQCVFFDEIRTLAFGSISTSYAAFGTAFSHSVRLVCITNNTDGDMLFSTDGITDMLFIPAGSFKLFDLNTNRLNVDQMWVLPERTQFYVKYVTAPSKNSVYLEAVYGGNG